MQTGVGDPNRNESRIFGNTKPLPRIPVQEEMILLADVADTAVCPFEVRRVNSKPQPRPLAVGALFDASRTSFKVQTPVLGRGKAQHASS